MTQATLLLDPTSPPERGEAADLTSICLDTTGYPGQYVVVHTVTTVAGVNLNRDFNNLPKRIRYGGVDRLRVSAQARLRAVRVWSRSYLQPADYAARSRLLPQEVAKILAADYDYEPDAAGYAAATIVEAAGMGIDWARPKMVTAVGFYSLDTPAHLARLAHERRDALATAIQLAREKIDAAAKPASRKKTPTSPDATEEPDAGDTDATADAKADVKARLPIPEAVRKQARCALDPSGTLEIALYGRMLANVPGGGVVGAVQVAHSFSVDPIDDQLLDDDYSVVDDWQGDDMFGAANQGHQYLASGTLYGYAALDRRQLRATLATGSPEVDEQAARRAEQVFVTALIQSVPGARRTRTGSTVRPTFVIAATADLPLSAAPAFEQVMSPPAGVAASHRLAAYLTALQRPDRAPLQGGVADWLSPDDSPAPTVPDVLDWL